MRNYRKERENYHSRPEQMLRNAARKRARRQMEKEGKAEKGDGKDVHHKDNNPLNNDKNNLSLVTQHYNRREPRLRETVDVKKALSKVKGITKKQIEFLQTLPDPALIQIVQQLSGLVMGEVKEYMTSFEEDAQAAADLKAKQAGEADNLKDKQEGELENLKKKHEREGEQQKKKDEGEKESEKAQDAREEKHPCHGLSEDDPCWKDYRQNGMKKKGGKMVPNCVPKEDITLEDGTVTGPHIAGTGDDSSTVVVRKKKLKDRVKMMARRR